MTTPTTGPSDDNGGGPRKDSEVAYAFTESWFRRKSGMDDDNDDDDGNSDGDGDSNGDGGLTRQLSTWACAGRRCP